MTRHREFPERRSPLVERSLRRLRPLCLLVRLLVLDLPVAELKSRRSGPFVSSEVLPLEAMALIWEIRFRRLPLGGRWELSSEKKL